MNKLISVIIPVRNGSNYLSQALESVLLQKMDVETIVVDDGSTDNTLEIARKYGCKTISHSVSKGQVAAKNTGLSIAGGEYVIFLDHDDRIREGALATLYEALDPDKGIYAVEAKVQDFLSPDVGPKPGIIVREDAYYGLFTGAILIRKSAFDTVGPFSDNVYTGEIMEWFSKMEKNGLKIKKIDLVSTDRRIHGTNFGQTHRDTEMKNYASVLRAMLKAKSGNNL